MFEEVASAFVERRAFEAALTEAESHRAANAALESQLGQAHADLLLAQADAETLLNAVRYATQADTLEERLRGWGALCNLARTAHPGTLLADEVAAARAREAGLKLAADQYSESRDQWMLKAKAAIQRGAADHAVTEAARALRAAVQPLGSMVRLSEVCARFDAALAVADKAGAT